ncbi:uncharacterized protein LOC143211805 [Lasioglossum baleicum]|uniref:uncharacterized protein LOC143211805 n=1 Tax=Lasioglossum baleicum TaxID=434251 RepID=UPI003FCC4C9A
MEMKSTASYPPPPAYSSTMPYPGPQPPSYGYPHPVTSGTPNHPVAPPTVEIGIGGGHTVEPNHGPSSMIVTHKYHHPYRKLQCCFGIVFTIFFIAVAIVILVKVIGVMSEVTTVTTPQTPTFAISGVHPSG